MTKTLLATIAAVSLFTSVALADVRDTHTVAEFSETVGSVQVLSSRGLVGDGVDVATLPQFVDTVGTVVVVSAKGIDVPAPSIADLGAPVDATLN